MQSMVCAKYPNTVIYAGARKIGQGEFAGAYRAIIRTVETSAWTRPHVSRFRCDVVRTSRADAMADAMAGQEAAVSTGYVPAPFVLI